MAIVYALVARGTVVLAEFAAVSGNAGAVARRILEKLPAEAEARLCFAQDRYIFHVLRSPEGLTFQCMANDTFGRRIPFLYLEDIQMRFMRRSHLASRGQDFHHARQLFSLPEAIQEASQSSLDEECQASSCADGCHRTCSVLDRCCFLWRPFPSFMQIVNPICSTIPGRMYAENEICSASKAKNDILSNRFAVGVLLIEVDTRWSVQNVEYVVSGA